MRNDFVRWLDNGDTILLLWDFVVSMTQLVIPFFTPLDLPKDLSKASSYYIEAEYDARDALQFVMDCKDCIDALNENNEPIEESVSEETTLIIDDYPGPAIEDEEEDYDLCIENAETEEAIDEIEKVEVIHNEECTTDVEVLDELQNTDSEDEMITTDEAVELFQAYYYSHGRNRELTEELFAY